MEQSTRPQAQPAKKRGCLYFTGMGCLVMLGLFLLFVGYSCVAGVSDLSKAKEKAQQNKAAYDAQQALKNSNTDSDINTNTTPTVVTPQYTFDLEALYGKNIDEIRIILGTPLDGDQIDPTAQQIELGGSEWSNSFAKGDHELLVTYNATTRNVLDFFIGTNDPSGSTKNTDGLKDVGNVRNTTQYTIESVPTIRDKSSYTGIKVIPQ